MCRLQSAAAVAHSGSTIASRLSSWARPSRSLQFECPADIRILSKQRVGQVLEAPWTSNDRRRKIASVLMVDAARPK